MSGKVHAYFTRKFVRQPSPCVIVIRKEDLVSLYPISFYVLREAETFTFRLFPLRELTSFLEALISHLFSRS